MGKRSSINATVVPSSVCRYHIHQMNTDAVLRCAFPYHETKIFVRLIQLLPTEQETHRWHWIHAAGVCINTWPVTYHSILY